MQGGDFSKGNGMCFLFPSSIASVDAYSLFDLYLNAQTCKAKPFDGLQALVEKVFMEGSLQVEMLCV